MEFVRGPEYDAATAFPSKPPASLESNVSMTQQQQNRKHIKFNSLEFNYCLIHYRNQNPLKFEIKTLTDQVNPFMTTLKNKKQYQDHLKELHTLKDNFKHIKNYKLPNLPNELFSQMFIRMDSKSPIDITQQRGRNPFLFRQDFIETDIHILATSLDTSNLLTLSKQLQNYYITSNIIIQPFFKTQNNMEIESNHINIQIQNPIIHEYFNKAIFKQQDITRILNETKDEYHFQYFEIQEEVDLNCQLAFYQTIGLSKLVDGGSMVLKISDLQDVRINQFLYILSHIFEVFYLYVSGEGEYLFDIAIFIGCHGYRKELGSEYVEQLIKSQDRLKNNQIQLMSVKNITQDGDFEKDYSIFLNKLQKFREEQFLLWRMLVNENKREQNEIMQTIEGMKTQYQNYQRKKQEFSRSKNHSYQQQHSHSHQHQQRHQYKDYAQQQTIMNPKINAKPIEIDFDDDLCYRRKKNQDKKKD